ncbi:hypothetical protein HRbin26_01925 [bacterium HR26]|nr:hypothetical protein HRbin26_01925 [bacterium HR26]
MAVEKHELLGDQPAGDLGHQHRDRMPASVEPGREGHPPATLRQRDQLLAIGVIDRQHWDAGLALHAIEIGRTPDGGADPLVDVGTRVDEDASQCASVHHVVDLARGRHPLRQDDLAAHVPPAEVHPGGEHVAGLGSTSARHVDQLAGDLLATGRDRHRDGLGPVGLAAWLQAAQRRPQRDGDEADRLVERVRHAPGAQVLHQNLDRLALLRRAREPHQPGEPLDDAPGHIERDLRQ